MSPSAITLPQSGVPQVSKFVERKEPEHVHGMEGLRPIEALSLGDKTLQSIPTFDSFAAQRQWQLEHMAGVFRHWARQGYVLGFSGHISVRDPEYHDRFWINPFGIHFGLLKASDMILVDLAGNVVGGNRSKNHLPPAAGFFIHSEVHKARPDVHAVCHAHSIYGKAWSAFGKPLDMLTQDVCKFYKVHSVYNSHGGVALAAEEGKLMADALGQGKGCILRNHGLLTVGHTVDEAAFLFDSMEVACQGQILAESVSANGVRKVFITDQEAEYTFRMESNFETLYAEFQVYYNYEDYMLNGDFKN